MAQTSTIEWTEATWNPTTGCTKISPGCKNCYAERFAERWRGIKGHPYEQGFDLKLWYDRIEAPLHWKKQRIIFVNSMSDLFHKDIPFTFTEKVFETMKKSHWHVYQVLTKRPETMLEFSKHYGDWPSNVWAGVTVENQDYTYRIDILRKIPVKTKFLSCEPLLSDLTLDLKDISWVIVGGESGPGARPMEKAWVTSIQKQCKKATSAFFFKQWGGVFKSHTGRELNGKTYDEMPALVNSQQLVFA